jgi:hypothetical protein
MRNGLWVYYLFLRILVAWLLQNIFITFSGLI